MIWHKKDSVMLQKFLILFAITSMSIVAGSIIGWMLVSLNAPAWAAFGFAIVIAAQFYIHQINKLDL